MGVLTTPLNYLTFYNEKFQDVKLRGSTSKLLKGTLEMEDGHIDKSPDKSPDKSQEFHALKFTLIPNGTCFPLFKIFLV